MSQSSFFTELKRRNVIRMAGWYLVAAWLITQVSATLLPGFDAPAWVFRAIAAQAQAGVQCSAGCAAAARLALQALTLVGGRERAAHAGPDPHQPAEGARPARAVAHLDREVRKPPREPRHGRRRADRRARRRGRRRKVADRVLIDLQRIAA